MRNILIMLLFSSLLSACSTTLKTRTTKQMTKEKNIPYNTGHKKQTLDVFKSNNLSESAPVVILIHGGGWRHGDKFTLRSVQKMLVRNGIPTVNMNYRLVKKGNQNTYHTQLEDVKSVVDFSRKNFPERKIILLGESAGAHLAMMYGYAHPEEIEKIISLSGPVRMHDSSYLLTYKSFLAKPILMRTVGVSKNHSSEDLIDSLKKASPLYQIANVPTLMIHGKLDYLVSYKQAIAMQNALAEKGVQHELVSISWAGHISRLNPYLRKNVVYPAIKKWVGIQ